MAKYTDPNTGVKYSTHTGLKVFAVIVSILLVVSIVLNVVLYMQSSDDELDSGESGKLGDDYGEEESGDDDDENPDGALSGEGDDDDDDGDDSDSTDDVTFAPPLNPEDYEDYIDTDTVVENEEVTDVTEFDENGVAKCMYYYDDCTWEGCEDGCVGHENYITTGGGVYGFYPTLKTQVLVGDDGSMDINSEIRVSLVFDKEAKFVYDENDKLNYTDSYYDDDVANIEIASLTGEPLEIESVELRQHVYYEYSHPLFGPSQVIEYHSEKGKEVELRTLDDDVFTDYTRMYYYLADDGYFTLTIKTTDGETYSFNYCIIGDGTGWYDDVEIQYVD